MDGLNRRVHAIAGKGGVGRTTVACGLAWAFAELGYRTLLLEVDAPDSVASRFNVVPSRDEPREIFNNLWYCNMTPEGSLREYALLILRFRTLYNLVFENRLVKYLLRSIPSLGAFTMAGKFWYHTDQRDEARRAPRFDRIVVDLPATGHAVTFLGVSRVVADLSPAGRMKREAERMARMIEDKESCLHIVARAEEMPINEALELERAARERLRMQLGVVFMNRTSPPVLTDSEAAFIEGLDEPLVDPILRPVRTRIHRDRLARAQVARHRQASQLPVIEIPELEDLKVGREGATLFASHLFPHLERVASEPTPDPVDGRFLMGARAAGGPA
ncbi:MAG: ArsA family ATPase [Myxococcota bacterium]